MQSSQSPTTQINLLYLGGTFGAHGTPLAPLTSECFLAGLSEFLQTGLPDHHNITLTSVTDVPIKDSSQLTPEDFVHILKAIWQRVMLGERRFLLITGTDTLAYLAAFLQVALANLPISLAVTGSMTPLFYPNNKALTINTGSDASINLDGALKWLESGMTGVAVSFSRQILHADSTQKMHSQAPDAFVGDVFLPSQAQPSYADSAIHPPNFDLMDYHLVKYGRIHTLYLTPNAPDKLMRDLQMLIHEPPSAVIIIAFGAGNLHQSPKITRALADLCANHMMVIIASSCPFGWRSVDYQAGSWQYEAGALFSDNMTLPNIYAHALWLCLTLPPDARRQAWQALIDKRIQNKVTHP